MLGAMLRHMRRPASRDRPPQPLHLLVVCWVTSCWHGMLLAAHQRMTHPERHRLSSAKQGRPLVTSCSLLCGWTSRERTNVGQLGHWCMDSLSSSVSLECSKVVVVLAHVVRLDDGAEHGEAVLDVQRPVIAVVVDACAQP